MSAPSNAESDNPEGNELEDALSARPLESRLDFMQRLLVRRSSGASPWEEPNNLKMMSVITSECKRFFLSTMITTGIIVAAVTVPVLFLVLFIVFNAWCYCHTIPRLERQAEEEDGVVHLSRLRHSLGNHLPNG
ncbi:hypothetical protein DFH11DRAFT_1549199 [Phellopilus nigrolimitatus]|nr:hypothetical protein DFH11DRAFT_1549199 [Phellopilus nigrolimitatus]